MWYVCSEVGCTGLIASAASAALELFGLSTSADVSHITTDVCQDQSISDVCIPCRRVTVAVWQLPTLSACCLVVRCCLPPLPTADFDMAQLTLKERLEVLAGKVDRVVTGISSWFSTDKTTPMVIISEWVLNYLDSSLSLEKRWSRVMRNSIILIAIRSP